MTRNVSTLTVSPVIRSLIRCAFTKPCAPNIRHKANWRKSSIRQSAKSSAAALLQELLSQKRTQIMNDISAAVKVDAEQIGVSVADVRIRRADLPLEVLQAINARMKTEREREAKEFRAQGSQAAQKD